ncbi:MAG: head-tail connector protein [Alphaproteobacteria bacterium]|nr:head-tail connector protein [Alphaproteobacteria bacterium]
MTETRVEYVTKRLSALKEKRRPYEKYWDRAAELCAVNSKIYVKDNDKRIIQRNFDGTAVNALTMFVASLKSILIPTNMQWARLKPSNPRVEASDDIKRYLEYVNNLLFKMRYAPKSNFTSESTTQLRQMGIYGQAAWLVEDAAGSGIKYRSVPMNEVYCDVNKDNVIDVVYRTYELNARQAVQEFGTKATPQMIERADKTPDRKFKFLHAIEPRLDRNPKAKDYTGMRFASYHICLDDNNLIYESGYRVNPYMVPRYEVMPGAVYGNSPALKALQDILTINEIGKTTLRSAQLSANPTIFTSSDIRDASRIGQPGAIVKGALDANGRPLAAPMQYGSNLQITLEMQQAIREIIEKAFLVPLFQSLTDVKNATAYEVQERMQEKALILAPTSELISAEWLVPNIEREIDILASYGYLDDVPDALFYDGAIDIEFESPAVHMQQAASINGLMEWLSNVIGMAQVNPAVLDIVNFEEAARAIADYKGVASQVIRTPEEVKALGEQRASQEQAAALLAAAQPVSQAVKNMSEAGAVNANGIN